MISAKIAFKCFETFWYQAQLYQKTGLKQKGQHFDQLKQTSEANVLLLHH